MRNVFAFLFSLLLLAPAVRAADTYVLDKDHTTIGFSIKHLGVSNVHGKFDAFEGTITLDPKDMTKSSVKVTLQTASIDTGNEKRDNHLRTADFFDAAKNPTITFASKTVVKKGDAYEMTGTLTIKGVSKDVVIPFNLTGPLKDPWGGMRLGAEGSLVIDRHDYGVGESGPMDAGIGNSVKIGLDLEASPPKK